MFWQTETISAPLPSSVWHLEPRIAAMASVVLAVAGWAMILFVLLRPQRTVPSLDGTERVINIRLKEINTEFESSRAKLFDLFSAIRFAFTAETREQKADRRLDVILSGGNIYWRLLVSDIKAVYTAFTAAINTR